MILVATTSLVACSHEKNKDYAAMNTISIRTVCVGRMLVDLPKNRRMDWQQQFALAKVSRLPSINTEEAFWAYVKQRKNELEQPTKARPKGTLGLYKKVGDNAVIMQFRDPEIADLQGYYTERYLWLGHRGYKYKTGGLFDKQAAELLRLVKGTFAQIQPIKNSTPTSTPGFCIDGALVTGKIGSIWSGVSSDVKGWKGVSVSAGATEDDDSRPKPSWQKDTEPLSLPTPFERLETIQSWASESQDLDTADHVVSFDTLRKRERTLASMTGEEIAVKATLANGQEWYRFIWSSTNDESRSDNSGFGFTLFAGSKAYTSSYAAPPPQQDLLALWDAMLNSLKPRSPAQ